jgi:two-component system C4-dicarboxylate transport sensor histidine kinase DctB
MARLFKYVIPWWLLLVGLCAATGIVWQASRWTYAIELEALANTGEERLTLYTGTLRGALSRYAYLPYVLAHNSLLQALLSEGGSPCQVNQYLEDLNREAGSDALYLMDASGTTLASSNWREPLSYVGRNYGFRPYFTAAKAGEQSQFFAIGVTTGQPGFFMSHPLHLEGRFFGVVAVKVNLDPLQEDWREGGETVMVSDANGVLFLSSRNDWKYHSLSPLSGEQRRRILEGRQYGNEPLELVPLQSEKLLGDGRRIVRADNHSYLLLSRSIPGLNWTLFHLAPLESARQRTQAVALIGTILALLILALGMYVRERRQKKLSRHKAREADAIRAVNRRLQEEIIEHRRTEQALRDAQAELVQSGKLAALGQMAAGIVHELNQPISAIRTYAASGRLLLDRQETGKALETFGAMGRITEHMASITAQLKSFAHKTPQKCGQVVIQNCLDSALAMTATLLDEAGVALTREVPTEAVVLPGGSGQLEQVLVNLIRNGVDAMRHSALKRLSIRLKVEKEVLELRVSDSGSGIAAENLAELFNPFFTTKEVGQGLGLGLSICYRIVTDLGGAIRAVNNPGAGACFIVRLPLAEKETTGEC